MAVDAATFESVFGEKKTSSKPRGRKGVILSKEALRETIAFANVGLILSGYNKPLTHDEINTLTDAWYNVIKEYPIVANVLIKGKALTIWGNALFVTYTVIQKRIGNEQISNDKAGTTYHTDRENGLRENDVSATVIE